MSPLRGIVTTNRGKLIIKVENGVIIEKWETAGLQPGNKVLIFYDFTKRRIRKIEIEGEHENTHISI